MEANKITSNSLQELINSRAEKIAKEFVNNLLREINKSGITRGDVCRGMKVNGNDYNETFEHCFLEIDSMYPNSPVYKLYEKKLKEFISEDTKEFVFKVERLVEQVDDLSNIVDNLPSNY